MSASQPVFRSAFSSWQEESSGRGRRPVVLDVLGPDYETSVLPEGLMMVLHVNPSTMRVQHTRQVERIQTKGGFVEQHWGDAVSEITLEKATGGFMRLYSGLSNVTNPAYGGTRRETIAYDKYLDFLALFHNNGSVYDSTGTVVFQGILKLIYDGGVYLGWFSNTSITESADKPYQFTVSSTFTVYREQQSWRSTLSSSTVSTTSDIPYDASETAQSSVGGEG